MHIIQYANFYSWPMFHLLPWVLNLFRLNSFLFLNVEIGYHRSVLSSNKDGECTKVLRFTFSPLSHGQR